MKKVEAGSGGKAADGELRGCGGTAGAKIPFGGEFDGRAGPALDGLRLLQGTAKQARALGVKEDEALAAGQTADSGVGSKGAGETRDRVKDFEVAL